MDQNNNELDEIKLLENQLTHKVEIYRNFKNSPNNESYFNNINSRVLNKLDERKSKKMFHLNPSFGYAMIFIVSFLVSFQLIDFSNKVSLNDSDFFFSETALWIDEEMYFSSILDGDIDLDYANYFKNEIDFSSSRFLHYDIKQLSDNDLDEIYENINKKIF
ncbi:MAG: hypothetical protein KKF62_17415 [Bacteroidetes bacterium]|nr:hypothetical protein [Bacteroidota bacterium]MBU1115408.1 hypothetical protein [Bacteroidota bacterium]MBU1797929.1 hypothetical protein [Bacteroidota bacterium]